MQSCQHQFMNIVSLQRPVIFCNFQKMLCDKAIKKSVCSL